MAEFADAAEELRADAARCYTALTPMQLLKGMDTLQGIEALRLFDAILVGGGPLLDDDRRAARELGIRVVTTYGSAETTGGCVYNGLAAARGGRSGWKTKESWSVDQWWRRDTATSQTMRRSPDQVFIARQTRVCCGMGC